MTGSSSQTSSTQPFIQSGPSPQAAQIAAQAQINAAQVAAQAATQNTQSAIKALMQQYGTSLTYANPTINTGNQAEAQLNYMLGLAPVSPGPAPVKPAAPTLASEQGKVTNADVNQWVAANSGFGSINAQGNQYDETNYIIDPISGYVNTSSNKLGLPDGAGGFLQSQGGASSPLYQDISKNIAQENLGSATTDYNNSTLPAWQQQLNQYNQQLGTYNDYTAKGVATPSNISNIVTNLPGFQFAQQQGIQGIQNAASASGMLNSGNLLQSLDQFGQGLSQQYYQGYLGNLSGLAGLGQQASGQVQAGANNLGQSLAGQYTNLGNAQANAALAAGQATASSFLTPPQFQSTVMTPYTTSSSSSSSGSPLGAASQGVGILSGLSGLFSDEQLKTKLKSPSTSEILDSVDKLRIEKWKYKNINEAHIGPYAQEFKDLFGVGDGQSINIIDLFGVLLGSVKELSAKVKALQETK